MFAVDVCLLPATGGTTGIAVAALVLLVLGVVVARWVRASAGRLSVVATVPILLMALVGASAPSVECSQDVLAPTTTTVVPTTTTTVVPVDPNLVLQIDTSLQGLGGSSIGSMAASGSVSTATTYVFELGLFGAVNVSIDWGDNTPASVATTAGVVSHAYATSDEYTITVSGTLTGFGQDINFANSPLSGAEYLAAVTSFGDLGIESLSYAFWGANNLVEVPTNIPATVTNLTELFWDADSFIGDISNWDTSHVTDMTWLFDSMDLFNGDISNWNTSNVVSMHGTFGGAVSFNGDISDWDTSSVTDMASMFWSASSFDQPLNLWKTSSVTDMSWMFGEAASFNDDISGWDTSNVTNMSYMFPDASVFNQSLSLWDTSSVTDMASMFRGALAFNQSLSSWDTSSVTDMSWMFGVNCECVSSFNQSLSTWNVSLVTNMSNMFDGSALSNGNYALTLIGWASRSVKEGVNLGAQGISAGEDSGYGCVAWDDLIDPPNNWVIADDSLFSCA